MHSFLQEKKKFSEASERLGSLGERESKGGSKRDSQLTNRSRFSERDCEAFWLTSRF